MTLDLKADDKQIKKRCDSLNVCEIIDNLLCLIIDHRSESPTSLIREDMKPPPAGDTSLLVLGASANGRFFILPQQIGRSLDKLMPLSQDKFQNLIRGPAHTKCHPCEYTIQLYLEILNAALQRLTRYMFTVTLAKYYCTRTTDRA